MIHPMYHQYSEYVRNFQAGTEMNERIEKLAEQAGVTGYFAADTKYATLVPLTPEIQKFAELIVKECSELTLDYKSDQHYNGWLDYRDAIRKHFGVEQ